MASLLESHRCFALRTKHEGKYLQSAYSKKAGSRMEASAGAIAGNARTRFFVEASKEEDGLVHVRCCYNNKYWVAVKDSSSSCWVIRTADGAVDDLDSQSCTLFKPIASRDQGDSIRFHHPRLQKYARLASTDDAAKPYLQLVDQENMSDVFTVLGLSQQKEMPKYVAFKQLDNNYFGIMSKLATTKQYIAKKFVRPLTWDRSDGPVLYFAIKDMGDANVICTVFTQDDGTVRIKSNKGDYFWRCDMHGNIIPHEGDPTSESDPHTRFKVIRWDGPEGFISLRNMGKDRICNIRRDYKGYEHLKAEETALSDYTRLKYDEAIRGREIYDVKFNCDEARIYDTKLVRANVATYNNDHHTDMEVAFTFVQKADKEIKWQTTVSETTGFESSVTIGTGEKAPVIVSGTLTQKTETTSTKGKEVSEKDATEETLSVKKTILPWRTMAAQLVAKRSSSDVPYSYKQCIRLTNGEEIRSTHEDGIYTVHNNYDFDTTYGENAEDVKNKVAKKYPGF